MHFCINLSCIEDIIIVINVLYLLSLFVLVIFSESKLMSIVGIINCCGGQHVISVFYLCSCWPLVVVKRLLGLVEGPPLRKQLIDG